MHTHTHQTAPTQFVEANGIRFRVVRPTSDGPLLSGRTSFVLDYTNVEVRT